MIVNQQQVEDSWVLINEEGKFTCVECENVVSPLVSSPEGLVEADLDNIKMDLTQFPTKIIYGVCPVCGMEYVFHLVGEKLYLEPSEEEK